VNEADVEAAIMFIAKKALSRRTFLQGAGVTMALPFLDAMVPALSAAARPTPRLGFIYIANGVIQKQWNPAATGTLTELPAILKPLEPVKTQLNVISGLAHLQADTFGDGTGDHPRASAAWLTGVHAYDRTQPGVEVRLATTADQIAARVIGKNTPLSSLELTVDFPTQGSCDSGDCFYVNTVSWRNETTPNPAETHPRVVFERLFGDGGTAAQRAARMKDTGSILDSITQEVNALAKNLGRGDRTKLNEYLDSVREIEQRIQHTESQAHHSIELPERPVDVPDSFDEYTKTMLDLVALAYQADLTRVFTMIFARELSSRTFAHIGVADQHHAVSHHRNDPDLITKKAKIDTYHATLLSHFLARLQSTPDGDGSLLDHSLTLYGGGMGDGNLHRHFDLPCLLAGKLGGQFKTGRYLAFPDNTPMTNLLLTILNKAGAPIERLGDSTGPLDVS
jgi:hypothetical protein